MSEKTEDPTEQRLREAREKGQVAKSQEVSTWLQLSALLLYFMSQGEALFKAIQSLLQLTLESVLLDLATAKDVLLGAFLELCLQFSVLMGGMLILVIVFSVMGQVGFLFSLQAAMPSFAKLNPMQNIQQIISVRSLFELGKSLIKILILGAVFYYLLKQYVMSFQFLPLCGIEAALPVVTTLIFWLWGSLVGCYVVFALSDYAFQKYSILQQLRMTKEEIKQEYKNNEGSPEMKSRRKELHQEIQSGSLSSKVKKSSVLIRNPTHIAICIYYLPGETPLPRVIEKGIDSKAERMVRIAETAGIPIVQNVRLARTLMRDVATDDYVPPELFEPVAAILRVVMKLDYESADPPVPDLVDKSNAPESQETSSGFGPVGYKSDNFFL